MAVLSWRALPGKCPRCHDEEANFLALNLMHDIVTDSKTVQEARKYYAKEFVDYRCKKQHHTWNDYDLSLKMVMPQILTPGYIG
jgi:hypothetical protein